MQSTRYRQHLSPKQAAQMVGITARQFRRWLESDRYPGLATRVGRCWAVSPTALEALTDRGPRLNPPKPLILDERFPRWSAAALVAFPLGSDELLWDSKTVEQLRIQATLIDGRPLSTLAPEELGQCLWHFAVEWIKAHMTDPIRLSEVITSAVVASMKGDPTAEVFLAFGMSRITDN